MAGLGATVKVAMDTSAVKRGLAFIKKGFAGLRGLGRALGKSLKAGFIGAAGIATGIAFATKKAVAFGSELRGVSKQTGVAVKDLLKMREAFRIAGVEVDDQADVLSDFNERIEDARRGGGTANEGLKAIGLHSSQLAHLGPMERFEKVLKAVGEAHDSVGRKLTKGAQGFVLDKLFGESGFKLVRLVEDYDKVMERAVTNTKDLGEIYTDSFIAKLDESRISMGRLKDTAMVAFGAIANALPLDKIAEFIQTLFSPDTIAFVKKLWADAAAFIKRLIADPSGVIGESLTKMGQMIGEAIGAGIKNSLPALPKFMGGLFKGKTASSSEGIDLLRKIAGKEGPVYA